MVGPGVPARRFRGVRDDKGSIAFHENWRACSDDDIVPEISRSRSWTVATLPDLGSLPPL